MKIVIGNYDNPEDSRNLILNDSVKDYKTGELLASFFGLITKVEGIETAPYRNGTGDWSGADGGYLSSQYYSARVITINGVYRDTRSNCDWSVEHGAPSSYLARFYIRSRLPIRTMLNCRIFLDSGLVFYTQGYCTDLKMDLDSATTGEYQITFYCPEPMLFLGAGNGALGAEWMESQLYKHKDVGYVDQYALNSGHTLSYMENVDGNNQGYIWSTGGRSSAVEYHGDAEYYPQIVVRGKAINPVFMLNSTGQTFSLGYPESRLCTLCVDSTDEDGAITAVSIVDGGSYDADYSQGYMTVVSTNPDVSQGAVLSMSMTKTSDGLYTFSSVSIVNGGAGYEDNEVISPYIVGAAIFIMNAGQTLVIDMQERTVLLDGVSYAYYITEGSEWFSLRPGENNNISFTSAGEDDTENAVVRWREAFQGI